MANGKKIVISLGGSLIVPDEVDVGFLKDFRDLILAETKKGSEFFIVAGGGKTCRKYQEAATKLGVSGKDELDWIGIFSTRFNAEFVRIIFGQAAHEKIITDPSELENPAEIIVFGAGGVPGHSSDFAAVEMAEKIGAKTLINLSNTDYVYDRDPKKFPDARKIERMTWAEFRTLIPADYTPGMNAPFDPVASRKAETLGLEVAIMNGKPLDNLRNYLAGRPFKGTVIN